MKDRVLVAGVGNIFLGDDAFGSEVARRLLREPWPEGVRVVDFGILGMDLMFALLEGYDTVILVDAVPLGGEAGTVYTIEADLDHIGEGAVDAHSMDPARVLAAAKSMGAKWSRVLVVGCEPSRGRADMEGEGAPGMSEPVERAVDAAAEAVRSIVCGLSWAS